MDPANTESGGSYASKKFGKAATMVAVGASLPFAGEGAARLVSPGINPSIRRILDSGVPLTPGQTLGGFAQRMENKIASWPVIGAPMRAAQERAVESAYPSLSRLMNEPSHATGPADLRPFLSSPEINRGATGLLADMIYSQGGQTALRTAISKRPEAAGLIGDYLRGNVGGVAALKGIFGH